MPRSKNYHLPFSVGELSCQLLRVSVILQPLESDPSNYFPHTHPFIELHYIPSGSCSYHSGDNIYDIHSSQLLIIPPNTRHLLRQVYDSTEHLTLCIAVQPPPDHANSPSRSLYNALHSTPLLLDVSPDSTLAEALDRIHRLHSKIEPVFSALESLRAYSSLLLAALSGQLTQVQSSSPPRPSAPQSFLIDQFFYNRSTMRGGAQALAESLNVSPRHLDRILLEICGMNFREKLNQSKLSYATDLLADRSLSIDQIAHMLGYSSSTSFGAFIKNISGKTPTQLRHALFSAAPIPASKE